MLEVRPSTTTDITAIAEVHQEVFSRQQYSEDWIAASIAAYPKNFCYTAVLHAQIIGYAIWAQKSGMRLEAVLELEQIAIVPSHRNVHYGTELLRQSLQSIKDLLSIRNQTIKSILVSTRADNQAQRLYANVLNAKVVATISNLYSADEVLMVAKPSMLG